MNNTLENKNEKAQLYFGWFARRAALVLFDVLASYLAYFLALVIRFFINFEWLETAAGYEQAFLKYAPYHAIICVIVFALFGLYTSRWNYAGINDFNRIFLANITTAVLLILGTLLFVQRMPITYYFIGAVFQFLLIVFSRFFYRYIYIRHQQRQKRRTAEMNVMVVGVSNHASFVCEQIECDEASQAQVVCLFSAERNLFDGTINGIPIVSDPNKFLEHIQKYQIDIVVLAEPNLPNELKETIRVLCEENHLELRDFSRLFQNYGNEIALDKMLEYAECAVSVKLDGAIKDYADGQEAVEEISGRYTLRRLSVSDNKLQIEAVPYSVVPNDISTEWVRETEAKTGETISFF